MMNKSLNNNNGAMNNKGVDTMTHLMNKKARKRVNNKGELSMNNIAKTIANNNNEQVKGDGKMTNKLFNKAMESGYPTFMKVSVLMSIGNFAAAENMINRLKNRTIMSAQNRKAKLLKQVFKKMHNSLQQGLEFDVDDNQLVTNFKVQVQQETELARNVGLEDMLVADNAMALKGQGTRKLLSIKFKKNMLKAGSKEYFIAAFDSIINGVYVTYNVKTGKAIYSTTQPTIESEDYIAYKYQFLGVTPSGLRTASIMTASTAIITKDGMVEDDIRIGILNSALAGAFEKEFVSYENGQPVFMEDTLENIFKAFTRVLQCATASKRLFSAKNYIIIDNIAEHAKYNKNDYNTPAILEGVSCKDTTDGTSYIASESLRNHLAKEGKKFSYADLTSIILQLRGATAKKSSVTKSRKHMVTIFNSILESRGMIAQAKGLYKDLDVKEAGLQALINTSKSAKSIIVVKDGVRYEGADITMDIVMDTLNNIEILGDWNAYKLRNFNAEYDVLALKQGYLSETKLNTVVNLMMQLVDSVKANKIIAKKVKLAIVEKFAAIGIVIETDEDGNVENVTIDPSKLSAVNNDAQMAQFLVKNNPLKLTQVAPQIMKSLISNVLISIKNVIHRLDPEVESHYTVVHSDPAVLFGCRLLGDREMFCNEINAKRVAAVRHPISSMSAVTVFNIVSFSEIVDRINALDISAAAKDCLREHFQFSKGFCTIPASHDLMEKHDGMDFDIDAMQLIVDEEVVDLLSQIRDVSTVIDRSYDVKSNISTQKSKAESVLEMFRAGKIEKLGSFVNESQIKSAGRNPLAKSFKKNMTTSKSLYSMNFSSVGTIVRDYFLNPIASIGMIATGFYNNAMILNLLNSSSSEEMKEKIATVFKYEYGCHGTTNYISPLVMSKSEEDHDTIVLHKESCTKIMFNYADSKGSVKDTIDFLNDCSQSNRYPGETSIDSAKKMYQIIDMFNHGHLIKALGSDKNAKVELQSNDEGFASIVKQLNEDFDTNYSVVNTFNMNLLTMKHDSVLIDDLSTNDIIKVVMDNKSARANNQKPLTIGVKDNFASLKEELVEYTNFLNVLAIKMVEEIAESDEAKAARAELITEAAHLSVNNKIGNTKKLFDSILSVSITVNDTIGSSFDFDEQNSNLYKKNEAVKILKNTATLMFDGYTKQEIGLAAMAYFADKYEDKIKKSEKVSTINRTILTIFEEEILEYLGQAGWNVTAGEKIISILDGSKVVKESDVEGASIVFEDGVGVIEDTDFVVTSENKHSNASGVIEVIDGHAYVTFDRPVVERDSSLGMYISVSNSYKTQFLAKKLNLDIYDKVTFNRYSIDKNTGKDRWSELRGSKNGQTYSACQLITNKNIADIICSLDDASFEIFYSSNKEDSSCFVHYNAPMLAEIIDDINDENDVNVVNFNDIAQVQDNNVEDIFAALAADLVQDSDLAMPQDTVEETGFAPVGELDPIFGALSDFIVK